MKTSHETFTVKRFASYIKDHILIRALVQTIGDSTGSQIEVNIQLYTTDGEMMWRADYNATWNKYPRILSNIRFQLMSEEGILRLLNEWGKNRECWCSVDQVVVCENDTCLPDRGEKIATTIPIELLLDFGRLEAQLVGAAQITTIEHAVAITFIRRLDGVLSDRLADIRGAVYTLNSTMLFL